MTEPIKQKTTTRACPLCGGDNRHLAAHEYSSSPWNLKSCTACGFVYLENAPVYERLEDEFAWEKTMRVEGEARRKKEPVISALSAAAKFIRSRIQKRDKLISLVRRYVRPGNVLDLGCGDGAKLAKLPREYTPYGVEVSTELHARAQERCAPRGGRVMRADVLSGLLRIPPEMRFTGIIMNSYLEHEINPREVVMRAAERMQPGARMIVKAPNYGCWNRTVRGPRWCGFRYPDHVNYFTPASLREMMRGSGLNVLRFGLRDRMPTSDNMWMVLEKSE